MSLAVFKADDRKKVQQNLLQVLRTHAEEAPTVEVFCPGRFRAHAEQCGLRSQG